MNRVHTKLHDEQGRSVTTTICGRDTTGMVSTRLIFGKNIPATCLKCRRLKGNVGYHENLVKMTYRPNKTNKPNKPIKPK